MRVVSGIKRSDDHWLLTPCQGGLAVPRDQPQLRNPCRGSNMQRFLENFPRSRFGWEMFDMAAKHATVRIGKHLAAPH